MKSLFLRIYVTVVAVLLAFALLAGALAQRQLDKERAGFEALQDERLQGMAQLLHQALPPASASVAEQAEALRRWSLQLRMPLALEGPDGERIAASPWFERREDRFPFPPEVLPMPDGRRLLLLRAQRSAARLSGERGGGSAWPRSPAGVNAVLMLFGLLFVGVAVGAYPVVRQLTRRLETLKQGVERFGAGELAHRVQLAGQDEVAAVAASFNETADRVAQLLQSHQNLVANASHELRSPLARLRMALAMRPEVERDPKLEAELQRNLSELDGLVEELLMSARMEALGQQALRREPVDLLGLVAEEAARVGVELDGVEGVGQPTVLGDERLLRRAVRNLLENARRYGGDRQSVTLAAGSGRVDVRVADRGPGVPEGLRDRIFEPFFRLPGHAEQAGGVGLGLALVRQVARSHGGSVRCEAREGGGSVFVISLPS
ncbi:MAG: ATP-binding protein [Inhella sp.]|uniref:HAMP domain-containing sensor histidine kinase n=2 Tax=Inhella sp. TaxID=1921806 RepID=UPI003919DFBF